MSVLRAMRDTLYLQKQTSTTQEYRVGQLIEERIYQSITNNNHPAAYNTIQNTNKNHPVA